MCMSKETIQVKTEQERNKEEEPVRKTKRVEKKEAVIQIDREG